MIRIYIRDNPVLWDILCSYIDNIQVNDPVGVSWHQRREQLSDELGFKLGSVGGYIEYFDFKCEEDIVIFKLRCGI